MEEIGVMAGETLRIGICGLGTVASGVVNIFNDHQGLISSRCGADLSLVHIGARRDNPNCDTSAYRVSRDLSAVVQDPAVDVLVELIGGTTTARDLVTAALSAGKHVVTANKALIAEYGNELAALADAHGVSLRFEAAVAGGIPVIKTLREALAANEITGISGIINGTGNFILTEMSSAGRSFADVLAEAQALGYAEADPTFDVDGTDAAHKLAILACIAFGTPVGTENVAKEGIDLITPDDLEFAAELGFRVKHLGIARKTGGAVDLRVHPTLLPERQLLARVDGVLNAVRIECDAVGELVLTGPGAGSLPTASAVCADLADLAKSLGGRVATPTFGLPADALCPLPALPRGEIEGAWYLRLEVEDRAGVMAEITRTLGDYGISIEALIQRPPSPGSSQVAVVIITDRVATQSMDQAAESIEALTALRGALQRIRVESFEEA
ncbi:MAG: homoserine dehydrogenase [Cellvibrionales bacterium]|jgi:homoserine dehydrogenase